MRSPRAIRSWPVLSSLCILAVAVAAATAQAQKKKSPGPVTVTVTVVDGDDGKPEPGVYVEAGDWVRGRGDVKRASGVSDERGRVTLELKPGTHPWIHAFARPSPATSQRCMLIDERLEFSATRREATITLPRHIEFPGVVRDLSGKPVAGAAVHFVMGTSAADHELESPILAATPPHAVLSVPDRTAYVARVKSGPRGLFTCRIRVANTYEAVRTFGGEILITSIHAAAFAPDLMSSLWIKVGVIPKGKMQAEPTQVTCFPPATFEVRLVDDQGAPIPDERVEVGERQGASMSRLARLPTVPLRSWGQLCLQGTTDAEGRATFQVPAGVNLYVEVPRQGLMTVGDQVCVGAPEMGGSPGRIGRSLRLAAGEKREFEVRRPRLAHVKGRVIGPDGKAIAGAWVSYSGGGRNASRADIEGRFELPKPVPLGGEVTTTPPNGQRIHRQRVPVGASGDPVEVTFRIRSGLTVHVDRKEVREVQLGSNAGVAYPRSESDQGGRSFRFYWAREREVLVIPAITGPADPDHPRPVGFHVVGDVDTSRGEVKVTYREPEFDAALTVKIEARKGRVIEGVLYLACVGLEKHPTVGVFGEVEATAAASVTFPKLQAGRYLLGFIPASGNTRRLAVPGEGRPARFPRGHQHAAHWARRFGIRAAARRLAPWRPVIVRPGENTVTIDLSESRLDGVLEVVPVDRSGNVLTGYQARLGTDEDPAVSARRTGRHLFAADDRGVIRIEGVRPGLYELHLGRGCVMSDPYTEQPTVIPSSGTHRIRIAFDVEAMKPIELPPLIPDPAFSIKTAELQDMTLFLRLREVVGLFVDGEHSEARSEITRLMREQPGNGMVLAALAAMIDGVGGPRRPGTAVVNPSPEDLVVELGPGWGCDAELAKLIGLRPRADGSLVTTDALDLLWKQCEASRMYGRSQDFRWWAATQRLHQLYRHHGKEGERRDEIRRLLGFLERDGAFRHGTLVELGAFVDALRRVMAQPPR